jgi:hypothetical protein
MSTTYPPGPYKVKTTDQGYTKSSQGTPEFFLTFLVLAQVGAGGTAQECQQFERTYYQALTDNTIGFFIKKLKAIGVEIDRLERLDPQAEGAVNLIGREITAYCAHSEFEGKTRERWDLFPSRPKKLSVEEVRKLGDIFDLGTKKPAAPTPPRRNTSGETI